jgi:hypothetical protein
MAQLVEYTLYPHPITYIVFSEFNSSLSDLAPSLIISNFTSSGFSYSSADSGSTYFHRSFTTNVFIMAYYAWYVSGPLRITSVVDCKTIFLVDFLTVSLLRSSVNILEVLSSCYPGS